MHPKLWDSTREVVTGNTEEAIKTNSYINLIRKKIYDAHHKLVENNTPIYADLIKSHVLNKDKAKSKSLFTVFEQHNSKIKALIGTTYAYGTFERYETMYAKPF